jgi:hypothetical protein
MPFFALCAGRAQTGVKPSKPPGGDEIHPIPDANPALRHFIDLQVPTELTMKRTGDSLDIWFSSFGHTNATVGYKMITGWKIQQYVIHDKTSQDYGIFVISGADLGGATNSLNFGFTPAAKFKENNYFEERVTFFESDVPINGVWSAEWGHYKILWSKTFQEPIE